MSDHAIYAPSSAGAWLNCHAGPRIAEKLPKRAGNAASERGTHRHKLLEDAILTGSTDHIPNDHEPLIGEILEFVGKKGDARLYTLVESAISDEGGDVAGQVAQILDYVRKLGPGRVEVEHRVRLSDLCWGTTDLFHLLHTEEIATIGDYKNGAWDVEAYDNKQMLTYAVPVRREYPKVRWFRFAIFQPNSRNRGEQEPIKQWITPAETVDAHAHAVETAVAAGEAGAKPNPGSHCRWCPAFGHCEATKETLALIATAIQLPPSQLPDSTIAQVARVLRGLEDWKKLVDKELDSRMLGGRQIPGAELKQAKTYRRWRDEYLAKQEIVAHYGPQALALPTPAQAEKLGTQAAQIVERLAAKPPGALKASY